MKKFMFGAALCGLCFTACQNDDVEDFNQTDPNSIQFTSTTARASITDLTALTGDPLGFRVYATSGSSPAAWYPGVDGSNLYRYASVWGWTSTPAPAWPTTTAGYPMVFYAFHPTAAAGFALTATAPSVLSAAITIQPTAATQKDFLAARSTTASKPGNGKLNLVFNHILSKVNFGVIAGSGTNVMVQSVSTNNVKNTASYNYLLSGWNAPSGSTSYTYYGTVVPGGSGSVATLPVFTPPIANETTAVPFYTLPHSSHLMLMPQTTTCWDKTTTVSNAHMGLIYRMTTGTDPNAVGYTNANNHPSYAGSAQAAANYTGPLFVKVGFPFASGDFTWDAAKGYTYNVYLGTANASNGYIADANYYDEKGNRTALPIIGKNIGDPIADGTINFDVTVTNWADQTPSILN